MAQKFDFSSMRVKRFGSIPIVLIQSSAASSSSLKTVTQSFSGGIFSVPVTKSQANSIASALK